MMSGKPAMGVRQAILVLLSEGPKSGPQLCEELGDRTREDLVYAALRQLERDGLVETG